MITHITPEKETCRDDTRIRFPRTEVARSKSCGGANFKRFPFWISHSQHHPWKSAIPGRFVTQVLYRIIILNFACPAILHYLRK